MEFEEIQKEFKDKYNIDIDDDAAKKIWAEEKRAKDIQEEAKDIAGSGYICEESNAKCVECSQGLLYIENVLYGNRCMFCAEDKRTSFNLVIWLVRAYYDYKVFCKLLAVKRKMGKEGRLVLLGCLGVLGMTDINQAKTVKDKCALLRELRNYGKCD